MSHYSSNLSRGCSLVPFFSSSSFFAMTLPISPEFTAARCRSERIYSRRESGTKNSNVHLYERGSWLNFYQTEGRRKLSITHVASPKKGAFIYVVSVIRKSSSREGPRAIRQAHRRLLLQGLSLTFRSSRKGGNEIEMEVDAETVGTERRPVEKVFMTTVRRLVSRLRFAIITFYCLNKYIRHTPLESR